MWQLVQQWRRAIALGSAAAAAIFVLILVLAGSQEAAAQAINPDILRTLQQGLIGGNGSPALPQPPPTLQVFRPVDQASEASAPSSQLENLYSQRAGRPLKQIGYDVLGAPATISVVRAGLAQDSYVLGIGDVLQFDVRGQENSSYTEAVDNNGRIILPRLNPIPAAGRTLGEFRAEIEDAVSRAFVATKVFVTLGDVHQVSVMVAGDVRTPGVRIVSALLSPLDAILLSGGISKMGSLRSVQLIRNGTVTTIDLYSILVKGSAARLGMLRDGDRIFVPRLGPTVAISGRVLKPGIYELPPGMSAIGADALVAMAGGPMIAGSYDLAKVALDRDGTTRLVPTSKFALLHSGEILFMDPSRASDLDRVTLDGAVQLGGTRPLSLAHSVNELFHGISELNQTAYTPFAVIVRRDSRSNAISVVPFSVIKAIAHTGTQSLQSNDLVYVFTRSDVFALTRTVTKDVNTPYLARTPSNSNSTNANANAASSGGQDIGGSAPANAGPSATMTTGDTGAPATSGPAAPSILSGTSLGGVADSALLDPRIRAALQSNSSESAALAEAQSLVRTESGNEATAGGPGAVTQVAPTESDDQVVTRVAAALGVPTDMLLHTISDHLVWVLDQVYMPGVYTAAEGTTLAEMIEASGGPLRQADLSSIEVTSTEFNRERGTSATTRSTYAVADSNFRTVSIRPLDIIRLRAVFADRTGETITVAGQVRFPGIFDITRDERLSSVLQRAGGLTEVAYPYGAIFTRRSAAIAEAEGNARSATELRSQIAALMTRPSSTTQQQQDPAAGLTYLAGLATDIRNAPALGRVSVTADPVVLASRPDLDVILEPGDSIYIPKRPSSVNVSGEVLNPGAFQFRSNYTYRDYVRMAGGSTQAANEGATFIVLPDGSASPVSDSWLTFDSSGHVPPGSTIVVPRDLTPFDWSGLIRDATTIISQLAVAAASLSVISRTN